MNSNDRWSVDDAAELYCVDAWGGGFFGINDHGHVTVSPVADSALSIDVIDVVEEVRRRGIGFPVLLRFQDILHARVRRLNEAFAAAIETNGYGNIYRGVYPIKVNQLHEVVEEVTDAGRPFGMGLECGSKPELVAALPHLASDDSLLICNGVKDASMLRLIGSAQQLGRNVIPVMEKYVEFEQLLAVDAGDAGVPQFGARIRLRTSGAGKWADSGGYRSKFGISLPELLDIVETLRSRDAADAFVLLHFHLGSQIPEIQQLRSAAREMSQIYAELVARGIGIRYLDVGGGVGVRYTSATEEGSINYGLQEYANAIVSAIREVCDERDVPHPVLVSESGRAMTAHHSVLVVETLGAYVKDRAAPDYTLPNEPHRLVRALNDTLVRLRDEQQAAPSTAELIEACHDIEDAHEEASALFAMGYLSLDDNALVERLYWSASAAALRRLRAARAVPEPPEVTELEDKLVDQYLCNFSVFQSMLDHWAIEQPFPIMPLARLDERPTRRGLLVDLTCDSDGKVSQYVSSNPDSKYLELHPVNEGDPYYIGIFLMGAYQDIMGDAHNLFGRVSELHVYADAEEAGNFWVEKVIRGTDIQDMLAQVQYFPSDLRRRMQELIKQKIDEGRVRPKQGMAILDEYMAFFEKQTYYDSSPAPDKAEA